MAETRCGGAEVAQPWNRGLQYVLTRQAEREANKGRLERCGGLRVIASKMQHGDEKNCDCKSGLVATRLILIAANENDNMGQPGQNGNERCTSKWATDAVGLF